MNKYINEADMIKKNNKIFGSGILLLLLVFSSCKISNKTILRQQKKLKKAKVKVKLLK